MHIPQGCGAGYCRAYYLLTPQITQNMTWSEEYDLLYQTTPPICQKFVCETSQEFILLIICVKLSGIRNRLGTTASTWSRRCRITLSYAIPYANVQCFFYINRYHKSKIENFTHLCREIYRIISIAILKPLWKSQSGNSAWYIPEAFLDQSTPTPFFITHLWTSETHSAQQVP